MATVKNGGARVRAAVNFLDQVKSAPRVTITLLTGYLGAGKTTLLNHILANAEGIRAAVIVNDIGEVNVDARLIAQGRDMDDDCGFAEHIVALSNGCICCTLRDDLETAIRRLALSGNYDHLLIEASGICEPIPIAQAITEVCDALAKEHPERFVALDAVICVADAARLEDEFAGGADLLEETAIKEKAESVGDADAQDVAAEGVAADADGVHLEERLDADEEEEDEEEDEDIAGLLAEQLEFCSTVILNKTDCVERGRLDEIEAAVRALAPEARIIRAVRGEVDIADLLDTHGFDLEKARHSAGWLWALEHPEEGEPETYEYGISTFVYCRRKPFDRRKFLKYQKMWPQSIFRCKGMLWYADDPDMSVQFEQAGRQIDEIQGGWWIAAAGEETVNALLAANPELAEVWDADCGDRMIQLVFIGKDMDREAIEQSLDGCLA